jgi:hypothetical protein
VAILKSIQLLFINESLPAIKITPEMAVLCFDRAVFEERCAREELKLGLFLVMYG